MNTVKLVRAFVGAVLFSVISVGAAHAGLVVLGDDPIPGNDTEENVSAAVGEPVTQLGRLEVEDGAIVADDSGVLNVTEFFTLTLGPDGTTGTVTYDLTGTGFELSYVVLNAGPEFRIFERTDENDPLVGTFDFSTAIAELLAPQGQARELSHITFFGTPFLPVADVPLPGAFWVMGLGLAAVGAARRKKAA